MPNSPKGLYVVWNVTEECNMACTYCYSSRGTKEGTATVEQGRAIIDRFMESPFQALTFVFHGGEPLLCFDRIKQWVLYAEMVSRELGKRVYFKLQSNLTLLTDNHARFLSEHKIRAGTSLDGWEEVNSKTRIYAGGRSSFDDTLRGLSILRKHQDQVGVICVVTRHNLPLLAQIIDFLQVMGFCACTLSVFDTVGRGWTNRDELAVEDAELLEKLAAIYREMLAGDYLWPIDPLTSLTRKVLAPHRHLHQCYPCGAGVTQVSIGFDGRIFPCDLFFPDPEWDCGSVLDHSLEEIMNGEQMSSVRRRAFLIRRCQTCKWKLICAGGCAFSAAHRGDLYQPGRNCRLLVELLPRIEKEISQDLFRVASKLNFGLS